LIPEPAIVRRLPLGTDEILRIRGAAKLTPMPPALRLIFRGNMGSAACGRAFQVDLPSEACRAAGAGERAALWLGPDEWLLIGPSSEAAQIALALSEALDGLAHALVDVSHRQTGLVLQGPRANQLLSAGCPLDLDLSAFPVGMCTRTILGKAEIILWRTAKDSFHIEVWRSFAPYLAQFLGEAAFGLTNP
jgi:sarcosine oxidase subunit gamma